MSTVFVCENVTQGHNLENSNQRKIMSRSFTESDKLTRGRPRDIYFEIYLASKRMAHDLVKLIYELAVVWPKQLTLSLVKAPRLLFASGFNSMPIGTGGFVNVRLIQDFYSVPRFSHITPANWSLVNPTPTTQFGARLGPFRFNDARGEARLQHIGTELNELGFLVTLKQGDVIRRVPANAIEYIRGSSF